MTQNDAHYPGVRILGYPTLYAFAKKGNLNEGVCASPNGDSETEPGSDSCSDGKKEQVATNEFELKVIEYDGARTVKDIKKFILSTLLH